MEEQRSHSDLECAALAWLGRAAGLLLSLPAHGEGDRDQIPAVWLEMGTWCSHPRALIEGLAAKGSSGFTRMGVGILSVPPNRAGSGERCPVPGTEGVCWGCRGALGHGLEQGCLSRKGNSHPVLVTVTEQP